MLIAIMTSAIAGILQVVHHGDQLPTPHKAATSNIGDIATFASSMFFSFEGIGLVLPVENSYTAAYSSREEELQANQRYRSKVLVGAMSTVALLFLWIGISASLGFPDITSGSITAYLEERFPDQPWYGVVNSLVILAVFLTFPLQLTPAMEVLDEWFGPGCQPLCGCDWTPSMDTEDHDGLIIERVDSTDAHRADALLEVATPDAVVTYYSCFGEYEWLVRRYLVVFGCAVVVLIVDDLGLLMSLFGAVGQTGLALMPCLIHWNLQRQGVAPKSTILSLLDLFTIGFSLVVMITGVMFSVQRIIEKKTR
jgi:amino acid transporter